MVGKALLMRIAPLRDAIKTQMDVVLSPEDYIIIRDWAAVGAILSLAVICAAAVLGFAVNVFGFTAGWW